MEREVCQIKVKIQTKNGGHKTNPNKAEISKSNSLSIQERYPLYLSIILQNLKIQRSLCTNRIKKIKSYSLLLSRFKWKFPNITNFLITNRSRQFQMTKKSCQFILICLWLNKTPRMTTQVSQNKQKRNCWPIDIKVWIKVLKQRGTKIISKISNLNTI